MPRHSDMLVPQQFPILARREPFSLGEAGVPLTLSVRVDRVVLTFDEAVAAAATVVGDDGAIHSGRVVSCDTPDDLSCWRGLLARRSLALPAWTNVSE